MLEKIAVFWFIIIWIGMFYVTYVILNKTVNTEHLFKVGSGRYIRILYLIVSFVLSFLCSYGIYTLITLLISVL